MSVKEKQLGFAGAVGERTYRRGDLRQFFGKIRKRKLEGDKFQLVQSFDFSEPYQDKRRAKVRATFSVEHLLNPKLNLGARLSVGDFHFCNYQSTLYYGFSIREKSHFDGLPWGTIIGGDASSSLIGARLAFYRGQEELFVDIADWGFKIQGDFKIKNVMPKGTSEENGREGVVGAIRLGLMYSNREVVREIGERLAEFYDENVPWDFGRWVYNREQRVERLFKG